MFIESFSLPIHEEEDMLERKARKNGGPLPYIDNPYPCHIFPNKELYEIYFRNITIFYGGNGSGKTTLLNLIAEKLRLDRIAPFNSGEMFQIYADCCRYDMDFDDDGCQYELPEGSRIITSDDVFDYMLTMRAGNDALEEKKGEVRDDWMALRMKKMKKVQSLDDIDDLRLQLQAKNKNISRREFIRRQAGVETRLYSNGETALQYFERRIENDTLYCLDEPENSLSPALQLRLSEMLETYARHCGCQFIIATHSPFLLAMKGARIYDLDANPAEIRNWWELENTRTYYEFFKKNKEYFEE